MLGGGCTAGTAEFLGMLRAECTARDIILIFDEVMTSRLSPAGLQGLLGIRPDMTTLGKYLGGGASFGAFGGRRDIMQRLDPARPDSFNHAGTFNNNVLSMAGGLAGLTQVFTTDEATRINALGDRLRAQLNMAAVSRGALFHATGVGSLIGLHFADSESREAIENLFHLEMIEHGFYFARRGYIALSLPTSEADCDAFATAVGQFLEARGSLIRGDQSSLTSVCAYAHLRAGKGPSPPDCQ
jgi:glutamate-1-semialdehyde 2,1-aminomutase